LNARLLAALALALSGGAALALPAVWWEPLHLDEAITIEYAERSYASIVRDVFVERGGAPVHFFVEHVTLAVPGGIEGLRLPSLVFFLLSLVLAAFLARELAGEAAGLLTPLLLAVAPLGLSLATFARMYSLFVAAVLGTTLLALRAARTEERRDWIVAGAAAGALVYIHPIAPLYCALAAGTGLIVAGRHPRVLLREAWPGAAVAAAVAAPYAYALAVLRSRYDVGLESSRLRTTAGRSVPEEALHALTPGGTVGAVVLLALALAGLASLARRRPRVALALALWLAVPVLFFALVPASTRFFGRYVAPAEPAFYILVAVGCLTIAGRRRVVAAALAAGVIATSVSERIDHLSALRDLGLRGLVSAIDSDTVLFSSTGTPVSDRPPELLDDYLDLEGAASRRVEELPGIDLRFEPDLEEHGRANVAAFVARGEGGRGLWIFRGPERRVTRAIRRLADNRELAAERQSATLLLVRSRTPEAPLALIEQGIRARTAWTLASPADRWTTLLLAIGRAQRRAGASP
jgi:hypothetical protein